LVGHTLTEHGDGDGVDEISCASTTIEAREINRTTTSSFIILKKERRDVLKKNK
jgi:hypothetical protein